MSKHTRSTPPSTPATQLAKAAPAPEPNRIDLTNQAKALVRLAQAAATYQGNGIFSPGTPITPVKGEEAATLFEYMPGVNLVITPRIGFGAMLTFPALRALAQVKEIRLNIELIKRQICGMEWEIVPTNKTTVTVGENDYSAIPETRSVIEFFEKPDGTNEWDAWLRMLLEDLLVIDAVTLFPEFDQHHKLYELNIVDGATIRPLLDWRGRVPRPPMPAYTQVLRGVPSTWYASDRILYKPLNTKSTTPYGETGAEQVLASINIAIRREAQRNAYFTEGNIPGALVYLGDLTPDQVSTIEEYTNAIIAGDIARASKLLFLPGGGSGTSVFPFQQNSQDDTTLDTWLMQVACWAFGNSPAEFGLIPGSGGLGGAGYMQGAENTQDRSMIKPISGYVAGIANRVIREYMGRRDVKFQFKSSAPQSDKLQQAQLDQIYVGTVYSADYVADREGVPQKYRIQNQQQPAPQFSDYGQPPTVPASMMPFVKRALTGELASWKGKAVRYFEKGHGVAQFESEIIPADLNRMIVAELAKAATVSDIEYVFSSLMKSEDTLKKSMRVIERDPEDNMKRAAEAELERAISEYFDGLRQRLIQSAIEL
jgi:hypothetical protein